MSNAWAEIQRLASDLQRVQLSAAAKKLSEANCIEVISKLIERHLIDVVFTRDGSAYITKKHLCTEVRNECLGVGGRISLTDISSKLNVDFEHVSKAAQLIVEEDDEFLLNNGELFAKEYVNKLQHDLKVLLAEDGIRTLASLCRQWELPSDILRSLLLDQLSTTNVEFLVDGENIYTNEYLEARTSLLRATLSAITKMTSVSTIQQRIQLPPSRFFVALENLFEAGEVPGKIIGSRTSLTSTYVPNIYEQLVTAAIKRMFAQDQYLLLSELRKMGVSDPVATVKSTFSSDEVKELEFLHSIIVPKDAIEAHLKTIEEALVQKGFSDISTVLVATGVPYEEIDSDYFISTLRKHNKEYQFFNNFIYTKDLLNKVQDSLNEKLNDQANIQFTKLEQRKKAPQSSNQEKDDWNDGKQAKGKKGGKGASKNRTARKEDESGDSSSIAISVDQVASWLQEDSTLPEELREAIAENIAQSVTNNLRERVSKLVATQAINAAQTNKRSHQQMEQQLSQIYGNVSMFETGLENFTDPLRNDLCVYLLKGLCTELSHTLLSYASDTPNVSQMKEKQREETINSLPTRIKEAFLTLYESVRSDDIQRFNDALFNICAPSVLQLNLKSPDKKTRVELCDTYTSHLSEQLAQQMDPAATLLTSVLYLYAKQGVAVNASGKFVSQLVPKLATLIDTEIYDLLVNAQKLVVSSLKNKDSVEIKESLETCLIQLCAKIGA